MIFNAQKPKPTFRQRLVAKIFRRQVEDLIEEAQLKSSSLLAQAQEQVAVITRQATSIDKDDHKWNSIYVSKRDLTPVEQSKLIEVANHLATRNPLAKRIREIRRDFVIGEGCNIVAKDPEIQKLFDETIKDPVNNWDEYQEQLVDYLGINGELNIPAFVHKFTGAVQWGWIDANEVDKVVADPRNRRVMTHVVMKLGAGAGAAENVPTSEKQVYEIIHIDRSNAYSPSWNYRVGNIHNFRINCAPDARRGRSDLEAWADLVTAWDEATFNDLERAIQMIKFIWDIEFTGLTDEQIEDKLAKMNEPRPGSMRAHNDKVKWEAVTPDLKAGDFRKLADGIRDDVLGAAGLSPFFFGITSDANRASAQALDTPILKGLTARQKKVKAIFKDMFDYVIDQKALVDKSFKHKLETGAIDRAFEVELPEISIKDLSKIGSVLTQIAAGLEIAVEKKWLSNETAAKSFTMFLGQFDITANYEDEQALIKKEEKESDEDDENKDINDKSQGKLASRFRKANKEEGESDEDVKEKAAA